MVDADHIQMVKFSGRRDKVYGMVHADLDVLVTNAGRELENQLGSVIDN